MSEDDLQRKAAMRALNTWEPSAPADFKMSPVEAARFAFEAGHAAGWRDRGTRDEEPPDGTVVLCRFEPATPDHDSTRVLRRDDRWAGNYAPGSGGGYALRRWYPLTRHEGVMRGDVVMVYPVSWAELLSSGASVTELIEGDHTWLSK